MSFTECMIQTDTHLDATIDCMICGSAIQSSEGNGGNLSCPDCGTVLEIISVTPLSLHYPGQDCGE